MSHLYGSCEIHSKVEATQFTYVHILLSILLLQVVAVLLALALAAVAQAGIVPLLLGLLPAVAVLLNLLLLFHPA